MQSIKIIAEPLAQRRWMRDREPHARLIDKNPDSAAVLREATEDWNQWLIFTSVMTPGTGSIAPKGRAMSQKAWPIPNWNGWCSTLRPATSGWPSARKSEGDTSHPRRALGHVIFDDWSDLPVSRMIPSTKLNRNPRKNSRQSDIRRPFYHRSIARETLNGNGCGMVRPPRPMGARAVALLNGMLNGAAVSDAPKYSLHNGRSSGY